MRTIKRLSAFFRDEHGATRRGLALALVVGVVALVAFLVGTSGPASATHVEPVLVQFNPQCVDFGEDEIFRIEPVADGTFPVPGGSITIVVDEGAKTFDWTSTVGIDSIIVKGGPDANLYVYDPPAPAFADTGLHSPVNPRNGAFYGLSHISFCGPGEPPDTPTPTPTDTPTDTPTPTPTDTPTPTPTDTPTPTPTPTDTPTLTPTDTPTPTPTDTPTPTPTDTPTPTPTNTPTPTPTDTPTDTPTATPTDTPTATPTDTPTATPTDTPTATPTDTPTATPTDTPTATPTDTPTATPTDTPTATPTDTPTATPTNTPTATPTDTPTATPTDTPTATPTDTPTATPTDTPTATPTSTPFSEVAPTVVQQPTPTPKSEVLGLPVTGNGGPLSDRPLLFALLIGLNLLAAGGLTYLGLLSLGKGRSELKR